MKDLQNRVMMITGAASGIGRACALEFASQGCHMVLCDINEPDLNKVAEEVKAKGRQALPIKADVSKENEIKAVAEKAFKEFGKVDVAMSNAGIALVAQTHLLERSDWDKILGVNFLGALHVIRYFVPPMVDRKEGHLVITASGAGLCGSPYSTTYTVSKFALVGLTEALRPEMAIYNVGVTTLCPAVVRTPIFQTAEARGFSDEVRNMLIGGMSPEAFARIVVKGVKTNKGIMPISGLTKALWGLKRVSLPLYQLTLKQTAKMMNKKFLLKEE